MVHTFKFYGQCYAYDIASGAVHTISEIQRDVLKYLNLPFENALPSSLRYDLAKYESEQLKKAYFELSDLCADGVLLSEQPLTMPTIAPKNRISENNVIFDGVKFVFATEVIRLADSGYKTVSATESKSDPVKESDYDIVESEYERIAKEIIKRKTGRIPFPAFEFTPFRLDFGKDSKGYTHILSEDASQAFGESGSSVQKKLIECAIAVFFS